MSNSVPLLLTAALVFGLAAACSASAAREVELGDGRGSRIVCWAQSSLKRVYPRSEPGTGGRIALVTPRNASVSFQACFRNVSTRGITVACTVDAPAKVEALVRRVGYVPMANHTSDVPLHDLDGVGQTPGLVPDPLFPEAQIVSGPQSSNAFWITLRISPDAPPGKQTVKVHVRPTAAVDSAGAVLEADLDVRPLVLQPRRDLPVTHWWNADCIYDWYKVEPFGDDWFRLVEPYLKDMVAHGSDTIFVPLFHHRREVVQRPSQLLGVKVGMKGDYSFDWERTRRFVRLARKCGFRYFEWPHLWHMKITPQGAITAAAEPQRVYLLHSEKAPKLIVPADYPATGEKYLAFLKQFLPELERFVRQEKLLEASFFHVSDEPGGSEDDLARYKAVRDTLRELAPWTNGRVIDAMSDVRYGAMDLIDGPVPNVAAAADYIARGIPHWVYYCCGPKGEYLNRFFDTPLTKVRMSGWLFYKLKALGFLHWGYNFWYVMDLGFNPLPQKLVDPFTDAAAGSSAGGDGEPYGDSFVVYPGEKGPISSIRWEVFAESLQDYALLQTAGISPDDPMLSDLKDYAAFPRSEQWINDSVASILDTAK